MTRWIVRAACGLALMGVGARLESVRAQAQAVPTIGGSFRHIGFVVRDVDATAQHFSRVFNAPHSPVHQVGPLVFPRDFTGDRKTSIRTTEIRTNGVEMHLLQPIGGASSWRDHLEKHGDGSLQHISFGVADLAGTVDALHKLGGKVTVGAGDSFFAYVEFPQLPFTIELEKVPPGR